MRWAERTLAGCTACGRVSVATPGLAGPVQALVPAGRRCGNTDFEPLHE